MALEDLLSKEELESLSVVPGESPALAVPHVDAARVYELGLAPPVQSWLPALDRMNQRFAQVLSARFDSVLWRGARTQVSPARSAILLNELDALPAGSVCAKLHARGLRGEGLLVLGNALADSAVERMLGVAARIAATRRQRTPVEMRLLRRLVEIIVAAYEAAWRPVSRMSFDLLPLQSNRFVLDAFDPTQIVIAFDASFSIGINRAHGFSLVLPGVMLEPLREALEGRRAGAGRGNCRWPALAGTEIGSVCADSRQGRAPYAA